MTDPTPGFLSELQRRNVFRVAIVYVITGWVVMQIVDVMFPALNLPEWTITLVAALLIIGFPVALIFAWAFELTAEGLKRDDQVDRTESIGHVTGRKLNVLIIGVLSVAVGVLALNQFVWDAETPDAIVSQDKSIAVLPFVNMSEDSDNEYFSDGVSEEILNLLAQIPELRVIGRTSSFQFKDRNEDLRGIGDALGVSNILEGSVRKSGGVVRVTAQLIDVTDGAQLWSETFDRRLDDIFAVQDEIAAAVARALRITLLDDVVARAEPPDNTEAYNLLLTARFHLRRGSARDEDFAWDLLTQALELEPGYAAVWSDLGVLLRNRSIRASTPEDSQAILSQARDAVEKALALEPDFAPALTVNAHIQVANWEFAAAADSARRTLALAPGESRILGNVAVIVNVMGQLEEALELTNRARQLDPLNPVTRFNQALWLQRLGRLDEAEDTFNQALEISPDFPLKTHYSKNFLLQGRLELALSEYDKLTVEGERLLGLALVHHTMGDELSSRAAEDNLVQLEGDQAAWKLAQIHAWRGDKDQAFHWLEQAYGLRDPIMGLRFMTEPLLAGLHDDPRWGDLVSRMGFPEGA